MAEVAFTKATPSQLQVLTQLQVWMESKQRSHPTKQAEQERGDAASVAAAEEAKAAATAAEAELVRMMLQAKEQGVDVQPVLQQHEGIGAVFTKALADKTSSQLQGLAQVWEESKQRSDERKQAAQERGDVASVAAAKEAKVASLAGCRGRAGAHAAGGQGAGSGRGASAAAARGRACRVCEGVC